MSGPDVDALVADVRRDIAECCHDCDEGTCIRDRTLASLDSLAALARSAADMEEALEEANAKLQAVGLAVVDAALAARSREQQEPQA